MAAPSQRRPQKRDTNSDVESEIDDRLTNVVANRKLTFPLPYPVGYRDVAQWDNVLVTHITMGNLNSPRREKQFWEKAYKWKPNDPRLSERETPKGHVGYGYDS